jgi:hypothetical protein
MTLPLSTAGQSWLEAFDADHDTAFGGWATEIAAALQRSTRQDRILDRSRLGEVQVHAEQDEWP